MENLKHLRTWTLLLSGALLGISLTQTAFTYQYIGVEEQSAILLFLMGPIVILGGATLEWITWMANPLAILAAYCFFRNTRPASLAKIGFRADYKSVWLAVIAAALAISFRFWHEVLAAESGSMGKILSFDLGYWLWAASIMILVIGISIYYVLLFRQTRKIAG